MTNGERIFAPVSVLALWTSLIMLLTGVRRLRAVAQRRIRSSAFKLGESAEVPEDVVLVNRNLMNLLEMPILFYVVAIALYVTRHVSASVLALAWIYVGLRVAHSVVHVTANHIRTRLLIFAFSNFTLVAIWFRFIASLL